MLRIYLDSSVIGGVFDVEFRTDSSRLFDYARLGLIKIVISDVVVREIDAAPEQVRLFLAGIPVDQIEYIETGVDAKQLAEAYIEKGVVGEKWLDDAIHVANASLAHVDCIVSWNFKHIVRLDRIKGFNAVNFSMNHEALTILSPKEVLLDESDK